MDLYVLIVDDEPEFSTTIVERFEFRGIKALAVTSGEEALIQAHQEMPDVVISDMLMPCMGGLELMDKLHELDPGLPVIIMTGRGDTLCSTDHVTNKTKAYACMKKPLSFKLLMEYLTEIAQKK